MKKRLLMICLLLVMALAVVFAYAIVPEPVKVDNVTPANELITKDYSLEQTYMLEAVFDVRDGFGDVHVEDLADEVHVKLECKRQIAQDRFYYIVQGNRRRCYVFTDAEGTVQNIIGVDRNFPTLDEIRALEDDAAAFYPSAAAPLSMCQIDSLNTIAYICCENAMNTYLCILAEDGVVIEQRFPLSSGKAPIYYYYTYEEWPAADAAWKTEHTSWSCKYMILPLDLKW